MTLQDDDWWPETDDYYDADPDPECCDHEDRDADILTGRAICHRCGHAWWLTEAEGDAEIKHIANYHAHMEREERRERWRNLTRLIRWPIFRLLDWLWPRKACAVLHDDEIPF